MSNHRLAQELKALFEALSPDLRANMKAQVTGKVTAVDEDKFTVDVEIADAPKEGETPGDPWVLTQVPVNAIAGGDGQGVYVLPDPDAEVTVGFKNFDITQPRVDGAEFLLNRTPIGGRAGSFTFADRSGQRITMRPDTGEIIIRGYNVDDECAGSRTEKTSGNKRVEVQGDASETVGGNSASDVTGNRTETIGRNFTRTVGTGANPKFTESTDYSETIRGTARKFQHAQIVKGSQRVKISGRQDVQVGGDRMVKVLGDDYEAVAKNKQTIIGGAWDAIVVGAPIITDPLRRTTAGLSVAFQIGSPSPLCANVFGGLYAMPGTPLPIAVPMVNGQNLVLALSAWATAVQTAIVTLDPAIGETLAAVTTPFLAALIAGILPVPAISLPLSVLSFRHFLGGPL